MMNRKPKVTVVIPVRNEARYIKGILASVIDQDYGIENMEIFVIDGMSNDGTRDIINEISKKNDCVKLLDNPHCTVPFALNTGIKQANGEVIVRLDAHSLYPINYVSVLVNYLFSLEADNVGGLWDTLPANNSKIAKSIAISISTSFGVGNATYRVDKKDAEKYIEVDTVPFGCYRRDVFERIGFFDEDLTRNQDNELNERLRKNGGKIYLIPELVIKYFARDNYSKLFKMFYQYGYFGPLVDIKLKHPTRLRRYVPTAFVLSLILPLFLSLFYFSFIFLSLGVALLYLAVASIFSVLESSKRKELTLIPFLFIAYFTSHISYGIGYLAGVWDFMLLKKHKSKVIKLNVNR